MNTVLTRIRHWFGLIPEDKLYEQHLELIQQTVNPKQKLSNLSNLFKDLNLTTLESIPIRVTMDNSIKCSFSNIGELIGTLENINTIILGDTLELTEYIKGLDLRHRETILEDFMADREGYNYPFKEALEDLRDALETHVSLLDNITDSYFERHSLPVYNSIIELIRNLVKLTGTK